MMLLHPLDKDVCMIDAHDEQDIYCRMLGHTLSFSYCRNPGQELFCRKIRDCWFNRIDIDGYLQSHFTREQIDGALSPPKNRIESLMDLVARAQRL